MIGTLTIERFKSIRSLTLDCRKVNLFIGAPDTGKTNILEALGLGSRLGWSLPLGAELRLRTELGFEPLFHRQFFDKPIRISMMSAPSTSPLGQHIREDLEIRVALDTASRGIDVEIMPLRLRFGISFGNGVHVQQLEWLRVYSYASSGEWRYARPAWQPATVHVPAGANLLYIARHDSEVYEFLKDLVSGLGWKIRFEASTETFRMSEVRADEILDYNLDLLSDSVRRLFFYGAILRTARDATLIMDEPDVFAFPPYPKTLGEMIAGDESNQFFLTTHNPYFLAGIVEKTPIENLALFVCDRDEDGTTVARAVPPAGLAKALEFGANVFFNLDELLIG